MNQDIPQGWIPLEQGIEWIKQHSMLTKPSFVLNNWEYKYLMLRIDMRTLSCRILPGDRYDDSTK